MQEHCYVIGAGEVGRRLAAALAAAGESVIEVGRGANWDRALGDGPGPRLLCMREDDLPEAFSRFPAARRGELVLVQNGFLEAVLGDLGRVARGLLWFTAKGDFFRVLRPSPFFGQASGRVARALSASGIDAVALEDRGEYLREMVLKGAWNCVVGLPLAVYSIDLERYRTERRAELRAVLAEACAAAGAHYGVQVTAEEAEARLDETTGALGWMKGGAKALRWRNGAVACFGRLHGLPTPVNDRLLGAAGHGPDAGA